MWQKGFKLGREKKSSNQNSAQGKGNGGNAISYFHTYVQFFDAPKGQWNKNLLRKSAQLTTPLSRLRRIYVHCRC